MNFYFAPLEGITGYIYRNAHNQHFNHNNITKYFTPFIMANQSNKLKSKDINDILPDNNPDIVLVPQILTNNADDFIHTSKRIARLGYEEINLNLGCPSGTVVAKNRGSGFLAKVTELDNFLDRIYSEAITRISIKTRIGKDDPEEFYELIEIFNKYPISELIIHPRIQKDFYKNSPNMKIFRDALALSKNPVCYNGDIFTPDDFHRFTNEFPEVGTVMIGRGLLSNPGLIDAIQYNVKLEKEKLKAFHDQIYEGYQRTLFGDRNVLYKMKEIWFYLISRFPENAKYAKKIKKAERLADYEQVIERLFQEDVV
ncbi:tRNA-dihydrouridine synthase family protein [Lachnospiraceae bacterium MD1]|uniref:tRNA-dihydrouridine synthase n=1 Tax=Variimorphobacter saccharofermentans TaxID=2755051 RepID=A0A839K0B1_9FIRM|nr:tRNA-dihydrouridine synthase family protein [Variimorphobacter saccharofermentans]MBB2183363.1 tRNA-dihydrouridine synthase family protein [Variimorphobacter saccharofermentans]